MIHYSTTISDREDAGADEVVVRRHVGVVVDDVAAKIAENGGSDGDGFANAT